MTQLLHYFTVTDNAAATLLDSRLRNNTDVTPDLKTRGISKSNFELRKMMTKCFHNEQDENDDHASQTITEEERNYR